MCRTANNRAVKVVPLMLALLSFAMTLFQLLTAGLGSLTTMQQRCVHVGFVLSLIYLSSAAKREKVGIPYVIDLLCAAASLYVAQYVFRNWYQMAIRIMFPSAEDLIAGAILIVLVIDAARRRIGWTLPGIAIVFLLYALFGHLLPGALGHRMFGWKQIIASLTMNTEGVYGTVTGVSATYIFLFILFGALLEASGAAKFLVDLATATLGSKRGGTALAATAASGVFGMISGSPSANVVTVGSFSLPMMEHTGYDKKFAGAVLASAGSGGQFMPPIMGAAAFIIAETLGVPYVKVALAALLPAVLYYTAIIIMILLYSKKHNIVGLEKSACPNVWDVVKKGFYLAFPLLLLLYLMAVQGWSPLRSGFWAVMAAIAVSYVRAETRMTPKMLFKAFQKGAMDSLTVASVCIISGIVIGVLSFTSLGIKFSAILVSLSGGKMLILLILAAFAGVVLGMGMATTSVYIVLAVLVAPALTNMGVDPLAAHLFVFYFGCLACITPPVATASFAAAGITDCNPFSLGLTAWKLSLSGYIIPFMFMYNKALLFQGDIITIAKTAVTALLGIYALSCCLEGYMKSRLSMLVRVILFTSSILLIDGGIITDSIGFALFLAVVFLQYRKTKEGRSGTSVQ